MTGFPRGNQVRNRKSKYWLSLKNLGATALSNNVPGPKAGIPERLLCCRQCSENQFPGQAQWRNTKCHRREAVALAITTRIGLKHRDRLEPIKREKRGQRLSKQGGSARYRRQEMHKQPIVKVFWEVTENREEDSRVELGNNSRRYKRENSDPEIRQKQKSGPLIPAQALKVKRPWPTLPVGII